MDYLPTYFEITKKDLIKVSKIVKKYIDIKN